MSVRREGGVLRRQLTRHGIANKAVCWQQGELQRGRGVTYSTEGGRAPPYVPGTSNCSSIGPGWGGLESRSSASATRQQQGYSLSAISARIALTVRRWAWWVLPLHARHLRLGGIHLMMAAACHPLNTIPDHTSTQGINALSSIFPLSLPSLGPSNYGPPRGARQLLRATPRAPTTPPAIILYCVL